MPTENMKCVVAQREVTIDEIKAIVERRGNTHTIDNRGEDMDAFEVALEGSKVYLSTYELYDSYVDKSHIILWVL